MTFSFLIFFLLFKTSDVAFLKFNYLLMSLLTKELKLKRKPPLSFALSTIPPPKEKRKLPHEQSSIPNGNPQIAGPSVALCSLSLALVSVSVSSAPSPSPRLFLGTTFFFRVPIAEFPFHST